MRPVYDSGQMLLEVVMDRVTQLTVWSEKVITWLFAPCLLALFVLYFLGMESLMPVALAGLGIGVVLMFVLYIWRFIIS